jgi:hypothetical protein
MPESLRADHDGAYSSMVADRHYGTFFPRAQFTKDCSTLSGDQPSGHSDPIARCSRRNRSSGFKGNRNGKHRNCSLGTWSRDFRTHKVANEVWGDRAARQTHTFPPRGDLEALTLTVIGEETRARYIDMAREELKTEAVLNDNQP